MAKTWSDVAGSSAFQALSLEQQEEARTQYFDSVVAPRVPADDLEVARSQFLGSTKLPEATQVEKPTEKGIIQRVKEFVSPEYKSVLETQTPTPAQEQANINQRLSLGAGPISKETAAKADLLRSGMLKEPATVPVQKAAAGLAEQNAPTFADMAVNKEREAELAQQISRQQFAEESPLLGSAAAGAAGMLSGVINAPTMAADVFNKTVIDPVLQVAGFKPMQRVGNMFGTEYLAKAASDFMPSIGKKSMAGAWEREEMAPWLMSKLAANSPQIAQQLIAAFAPPLRAGMLLGMSGTAAGQSFAQGDDSRVAMMKGAIEYGTEKLPLGVFDKVGDMFKGVPVPKQNAILAIAGQRLLQAGTQLTANNITNAIEETVSQFGGNVLDKYLQGKDIDLTKGLAESAVVGGITGAAMSAPQIAATLGGANERPLEPAAPEVSTAEQMAKERGFLTPERPPVQMTNFTPADSPTKAAGLVDIVVPVPVSTPTVTPLAEVQINPETEQQFGLDKLRLGTTDVGVPSTTGTTNVPSGAGGGVETVGGVGATGPGVAGAAGAVAPATTAAQLGGGQVAAAGAATGEQPTTLKQEWYGRRGDGYLTQPDAQQALPGRQRMFPDLQWQVEPLPTGKFRLAGYQQQETNLGTQTTQAQQAAQEGQQAPASAAAVTGQQFIGNPALADTAGTVTFSSPAQLGAVKLGQLKLLNKNFTRQELDSGEVVFTRKGAEGAVNTQTGQAAGGAAVAATEAGVAPAGQVQPTSVQSINAAGTSSFSSIAPETVSQDLGYLEGWSAKQGIDAKFSLVSPAKNVNAKLAEVVARIFKAPIAFVKASNGNAGFNGFTIDGRLYMNAESRAPLVTIAMHEVGHNLPNEIKKKMIAGVMQTVTPEQRAKFLEEFPVHQADSKDVQDEELAMRIIEQDAQNAEFWSALAERMGNSDFAKLAKEILRVLDRIIAGFTKEDSSEFTSDIKKVRELVADAYAEAEQEVLKQETKAAAPVPKDEAIINGVVYSSSQRNLVELPTIDFQDLVDKKVVGIKADLTDAGVSYTGIDGSQLEFPIEMMGGPNFVALPENVASNVVWAVRGGATLTKILNAVNASDYVLVHAMNNNSHLTNATISQAYIQTVEAYLRDKRISRENLLALDEMVRDPANKVSLPDFPGFESPNILEYIDGLSFDQRGDLAKKILEKKEAQAHGLPNLARFRRETIDPEYAGYRQGDAMLVIQIDKKNPTVKLGEEGTKMHPSYPLGLRGKVVGKLSKGVNYETIFRDYFENKVPTLKRGDFDAWYTFDRAMPVQTITKDIANSVSAGGYKAIKSARQAEALLALGNSSWLVSGKTKAEGGVSVQEFVDALKSNEGAAALTMYTPEQVKAGIKDKSFTVYQLGTQGGDRGLQVFFGLKRGAPWYKDMVDGITDNEVEVVSVTNNENGAPGIGIPAIITKAIQEGATVLDAFAVKSKRFPNGFLPEMYREFGFQTVGTIPFDESYYDANQMADLKKFWADSGWQESDGYPDVVVMKWKGKDEDRATATERYARSGDTGLSGKDVELTRSAATPDGGRRNTQGGNRGRVGRGNRRQAGGVQGTSDAASVVGRAYSGIQELAALSDGDIRNLGLNQREVDKLRASVGKIQRAAKATGPAEPVGRPSVSRDKGESAKVEGAIHYGRSAGLSVLSGTSFGSGIKGAEQQRLAQPGVDPRIKRRVYFYLPVAGGIPQAEIGLGANVYTANLSNLFDPQIKPIAGLPADANAMESAILDAGYRGYINREQGTAVVLNSDVPVKAMGRAEEQTIVKRKPQVTAQKISTREEGNELVRKPTEREMMDIIKVRPELTKQAPSFKLEYGSARVATAEAPAANAVLKKAGSTFAFSTERGIGIGQALQERINANPEKVIGEYENLKGTDGGRILDTDMVRELSPEYRADRSRAAEVHEAASTLTQAMFEKRMYEQKPSTVAFMAGGGGAGKSTANELVGDMLDKSHTVLDGTLSSYDKAKRNVQLALELGNEVKIVYVYREPVEALRNGVLTRAERTGRTVTIDALVKGHAGSSNVVRKLQSEFGDNPMFELITIDNSRGQGNAKVVDLKDITPVIQSGLKERLQNATENEYQSGRIGETVRRATTANYPDAGREAETADGLEGNVGRNQGVLQKRGGPKQLQLEVTGLLQDLHDGRGLKLARAQERLAEHPLRATIEKIDNDFYDIIGQLEEDGLIKINCK